METTIDAPFEEIRQQFMDAWETGRGPTLESYLRRYPRFAPDLAEFAALFFEMSSPGGAPLLPAGGADPAPRRILSRLRAAAS